MKPRQVAARLAVAGALLLTSGSLIGCTGREHKEVLEVSEKAKKKVEGINDQLEKRAETLVEGNS